jgi:hypothetical protein
MFFVGKMSSVGELLAFATIACVLKKKERKRRRLWRKEWLNRNNYTHINEGRSLNSSINSDKNSFDHVAWLNGGRKTIFHSARGDWTD